MRKFQINKYGMLCATIMLVILIASCSRQGSDKQIDRISVVPSQTNENQVSYAEGQRQRVQEKLKKNGVAILHEPPRKNLDSPIVKLSSGVCFDTSKLPEG